MHEKQRCLQEKPKCSGDEMQKKRFKTSVLYVNHGCNETRERTYKNLHSGKVPARVSFWLGRDTGMGTSIVNSSSKESNLARRPIKGEYLRSKYGEGLDDLVAKTHG